MSTIAKDQEPSTISSSSSLPPFYTDTPLPLIPTPYHTSGGASDPFTIEASHMALSHNVLIRGFNSIYQTAPRLFPTTPSVTPLEPTSSASSASADINAAAANMEDGGGKDDKDEEEVVGTLSGQQLEQARADFVTYCLAWARLVDEHHRVEEEGIFPEVERIVGEKGVLGREEEEHVAIHNGITSLRTYLLHLTSPHTLFPPTLLSILSSLSIPLHAHLTSEPLTLSALKRFSAAFETANTTLKEISLTEGRKAMASREFVRDVLPCFLLNMEFEEFEGGWWRFASCDEGGRRRRLVV